jgi:hypothetical protein
MPAFVILTATAVATAGGSLQPGSYCDAFELSDGGDYSSTYYARGPGVVTANRYCDPVHPIADATWWSGCVWKTTHVRTFDPTLCGPAMAMTVFSPGSYRLRRDSGYECCHVENCRPWHRYIFGAPAAPLAETANACAMSANASKCLRSMFPRPLCAHEVPVY